LRRGVCWEIWRAAIRTIKWTLFFRR